LVIIFGEEHLLDDTNESGLGWKSDLQLTIQKIRENSWGIRLKIEGFGNRVLRRMFIEATET
jgi:hypothetical protein